MAKYLLEKNAFIGSRWYRAGSVVEYDGAPGPHMVALDDGAETVVEPAGKKTLTKKATP